MSLLMGRHSTSQIVRRADVDVAIAQFEEVDVPHAATVSLRPFGRHPSPFGLWVACHPKPAGRRVAEPEGFEPSIGLYNPITV